MFLEIGSELELIDRNLKLSAKLTHSGEKDSAEANKQGMQLTLLYVALYTPGPAVPLTILPSDICWSLSGSAIRDRPAALDIQFFNRVF
jgi:hypothetical protein